VTHKTKIKTVILVLLLVVFTTTTGVLSALYLSGAFNNISAEDTNSSDNTKRLDDNGNAIDGAVESKTPEQIQEDLQKEQINVTDKLSSHILFPNGKSGAEGSWTVENLKANNVIMQCEVYLDDKLIAKSLPIKPNQHIETITLADDVNPGQYDVIAYINYFKLDTNEYISKAGFKIKLTVQ